MALAIAVPQLGIRMRGGLVAEWYQPDGASVQEGEPICRLECDSVAFEVEAEGDGVLRHRLDAGLVGPPGELLGVILGRGERMPQFEPVHLEALLPDVGEEDSAGGSDLIAAWKGAEESGDDAEANEPRENEWFDLADMGSGTEDRSAAGASMDKSEAAVSAFEAGDSFEQEEAAAEEAPRPMPFRRRIAAVEREANAGDTWDIVPGDSADFATELFGVPRDATLEPHVEPMAPDDEEPESSEFAAWLDTEPEAPVIAPQADEPEQDWQQWSDDAVRARDEQAARAAALTMRVTLALGEAQKMRESLAREWRASGVKPSTEDVVLRAAARAFRELPFVQTGSAMLRSFENGAESARLLSAAASRPFRDAVESMALDDGSEADFVLTAYGEVGIEEATPSLEAGQVLALALGCERVEPLWDGERFLPAVSAALTLAYEPGELGDALAARFLARLHELVESPYALLAD